MMRDGLYKWLHRTWYEGGSAYRLLMPLACVYWLVITARRYLYRFGVLSQARVGVPVIIVGNLTAGGTGKTPVTIWIADALKRCGFRPGIVSRGYGGSRSSSTLRVDAASDPAVVGDEPVLLARRSGCCVAVDRSRARAAAMLIEEGADLIIADDGLQHLRLARSYEICVIDGARGLGNRWLLPAGPLRETASRLTSVDQILVNGAQRKKGKTSAEQNAIPFELVASDVCRLNGSRTCPIGQFSGTTVHAIAAIGNPARFFDLLRSHGLQVIEHVLRDHVRADLRGLPIGDGFDVFMTEKDAVKLGTQLSDRFWYVPVSLAMDPALSGPWLEQIETRMRTEQAAA